jgi:hypothetical protein
MQLTDDSEFVFCHWVSVRVSYTEYNKTSNKKRFRRIDAADRHVPARQSVHFSYILCSNCGSPSPAQRLLTSVTNVRFLATCMTTLVTDHMSINASAGHSRCKGYMDVVPGKSL